MATHPPTFARRLPEKRSIRDFGSYLIAIGGGMAWGVASNEWLFLGSWQNFLWWGTTAFFIGFCVRPLSRALWVGGWFGLSLAISFLLAGFRGSEEKFLSFTFLCFALGIFSGLCAALCAFAGHWIRSSIS